MRITLEAEEIVAQEQMLEQALETGRTILPLAAPSVQEPNGFGGDAAFTISEMLDRTECGVRGWGTGEISAPLELPVLEVNRNVACLLSLAETQALSRLLGRLLTRGAIKRALRLAYDFNFYHPDLVTIQVVYFLSQA